MTLEQLQLMKNVGFWPEDFTDLGLNPSAKEEFHTHLGIEFFTPFSFLVNSEKEGHDPYKVTHNMDHTLSCQCPQFVHRSAFCKHQKRATLVLNRRKEHQPKKKVDADSAPLNGNRSFSILR